MQASDVIRVLRSDPGAYAEVFLLCAGTLWHRQDVVGLQKVDDMLIANRGVPKVLSSAMEGEGRAEAARACGQVLRGMTTSRAAREHGVWLGEPSTVTGRLLAAALDGVDWDEVGSKMLAAVLAQLDYQAAREELAA